MGQLSLFTAIRIGDLESIREDALRVKNLDFLGPEGFAPIHLAARYCNLEIIDWLIRVGANIHQRAVKPENHSVFHFIVEKSDEVMTTKFEKALTIQFFVDRGALVPEDLKRPIRLILRDIGRESSTTR